MRRILPLLALAVTLPAAHAETITNFVLTTSLAQVTETYSFTITPNDAAHMVDNDTWQFRNLVINGDPSELSTLNVEDVDQTWRFILIGQIGSSYIEQVASYPSPLSTYDLSTRDMTFQPGHYLLSQPTIGFPDVSSPSYPPSLYPLDSAVLDITQETLIPSTPSGPGFSTPPTYTPPPAVTPEPSSFALLGTGLLATLGVTRKRFA